MQQNNVYSQVKCALGRLYRQVRSPMFWTPKNWSIAQKIAIGYTGVIVLASMGSIYALSLGDRYVRNSEAAIKHAESQLDLLQIIQVSALSLELYPQRLLAKLNNQQSFELKRARFEHDGQALKRTLAQLEAQTRAVQASATLRSPDNTNATVLENVAAYRRLLDTYSIAIAQLHTQLAEADPEVARETLTQAVTGTSLQAALSDLRSLGNQTERTRGAVQLRLALVRRELEQAETLHQRIASISVLMVLVASIALAIYSSRRLTQPIRALDTIAQRVTETEDFSLRASPDGQDEVANLARSFNRLLEWMGDRSQRMQRKTTSLEAYIRERSQDMAIARDQLQETQAQLIQAEKLSSLGEMTAGIIHEINNPVNFIRGNLTHLEGYVQDMERMLNLYAETYPFDSPEIGELKDEIELEFLSADLDSLLKSLHKGTTTICEIVESMRNFARLDASNKQYVKLDTHIDSTLLLLGHRLKQGITLEKVYGDLPDVPCYPSQLGQVLMNLIGNAIDAIAHQTDPKPNITLTTTQVDAERVAISVRDNGAGISEDVRDHIFDAFFTTKPVGKGTGLGLAICQAIMDKHQGKLILEPPPQAPERGTCFTIVLPLV